ncbi:L-2-hydroxyglutarate dehydrogenase, mitochondrial, partial [Tetrabaena socialis]
MLYDFCRTHGVPFRRVTKLIVASSREQVPELSAFRAAAAAYGVPDLQLLSGAEAGALEPALRCEGALLSPSTGILDSHSYMTALLADAEAHGAVLATHTRVRGGWVEPAAPSAAAQPVPYKVLEVESTWAPQEGGGG